MLTHIDDKNQPTMVDVTEKAVTTRLARAETLVQLPREVGPLLVDGEIHAKKGPVFQTAIIAGTMAAKRTSEAIPFCHPIPIEGCRIEIGVDAAFLVTISCEVKTTYKTGVEMEALHGATIAALTIYDMLKAVSHAIVIRETRLVGKSGGKRTVFSRPTYGLVLTGGKSERMGRDKALLEYRGQVQAAHLRAVLAPYCAEVYLSARPRQWTGTALENLPTIVDGEGSGTGPIAGILAAFERHPDANWFVVACDLPFFDARAVDGLIAKHDPSGVATAYRNAEEDFPEPLAALYTPHARALFLQAVADDIRCPVKVLRRAGILGIDRPSGVDLANINTAEEFREVQNAHG